MHFKTIALLSIRSDNGPMAELGAAIRQRQLWHRAKAQIEKLWKKQTVNRSFENLFFRGTDPEVDGSLIGH